MIINSIYFDLVLKKVPKENEKMKMRYYNIYKSVQFLRKNVGLNLICKIYIKLYCKNYTNYILLYFVKITQKLYFIKITFYKIIFTINIQEWINIDLISTGEFLLIKH